MTDIKYVAFDVHQAAIKVCMLRCEPSPTLRQRSAGRWRQAELAQPRIPSIKGYLPRSDFN